MLPREPYHGIMIDGVEPSFGWADITGPIEARSTGPTAPSYTAWNGGIRKYQFSVGDEAEVPYHWPHEYAGLDAYIHVHWSIVNTGNVTGGSVTWGWEMSWAKGFRQAEFSAPIFTSVTGVVNPAKNREHCIDEVQITSKTPTAAQFNTEGMEVDGLLETRIYLISNDITVSGGAVPDPFLHLADVHVQVTNGGTKSKAPNFYV